MERKHAQREQILHLLEEAGELTADVVARVSEQTGVPEADVWGAGRFYTLLSRPRDVTRVCQGLSCKLAGSDALHAELGPDALAVSCLGQCDRAPVAVGPDLRLCHAGRPRGGVSPDDPTLPMNLGGKDGATYAGLARARELGGDAVIDQLRESGLQGRGGAGFPAHIKWRAVRDEADPERYIVCNADEGEPGPSRIARSCCAGPIAWSRAWPSPPTASMRA